MRDVHVRWADGDAHELLRRAVAELAGVRPTDVEVRHHCAACGATEHGRPVVVVLGRPGPHVSVSRARDRSVVAVAGREVGIDVEAVGEPSPQGEPDLRTWVRKEAVLKALGHGLAVDPRLLDVSSTGPRSKLARWDGPGRRRPVRLHDLQVDDGYLVAVACVGRGRIRISA